MVLENFIRAVEGVAEVVHFVDHDIVPRMIRDPLTGRPKRTNVLVFRVDERNGRAVSTEYSFTAERAAENFKPFLVDKSYRDRLWTIVPRGVSYQREYEITSKPITTAERDAIEARGLELEQV